MNDEDYWNTSNTTGFNFEDDEVPPVSSLFITSPSSSKPKSSAASSLFGDVSENLSGLKPLEALVSKRSLALLLGNAVQKKGPTDPMEELSLLRKQVAGQWEAPPVSSVIRAIILDKPYTLHLYRSLEAKTLLLSEAVRSGDGNAILAVVLFLQNTLKKKIFCQLLQTNSAALPVYINYLTTRFEARAVIELLQMLGHSREAAMKDFHFSIQPHQNIDKRLQKLKGLLRDHYSSPDTDDKLFVDNFLKYVDWQTTCGQKLSPLLGTVATSLTYLCSHHWEEVQGRPLAPLTLTSLLDIHERLYHWTAITARALSSNWDDISNLVLTKSWLGSKKLKTPISAERIVMELHKRQAPETVISDYFAIIDSSEKQLELARKLSWHKAAIDTLVAMRDRQGLVQYQANLNPQSSDYIHAETALRINMKWKN